MFMKCLTLPCLQKFCMQCDLKKGKYTLFPYTTGCRFHKRVSEPKVETKLVKKDRDDKFVLTKAFKYADSRLVTNSEDSGH